MFVLYAVLIAVPLGYLLGGRLDRLGAASIRFAPIALLALAVQVVLFSGPIARIVGPLGPPLYVLSTAAVFGVVLANVRVPGFTLIALGAGSNLAAILANGGYMPADPAALAAVGDTIGDGYSNSIVLADPLLRPLTDILAMPAWMPFANVFSIGDVLISVGLAWAIIAAMRGSRAPIA